MITKERNDIADSIFKECKDILEGKGIAYSGEEDVNNNFKANAKLLGLTKYQILAIYLNKHLDSIMNAIRYRPEYPSEKTEGMRGRIVDAINYLVILQAMMIEDETSSKKGQEDQK